MKQLCETEDFEIKSLGIQKIPVYDIEVENNHNFFANDILVHNSNYLSLEEVIEKLGIQFNSYEEFDKWMVAFIDDVIQPEINRALDEYAFEFGVPNIFKFGYEKIIWSMFVTGGKNYALSMVRDDKDTFYDKPKSKITGIPIKKKTALEIAKFHMSTVLDMILAGTTRDKIIEYLRPVKENFFKLGLEDLAITGKVGDYNKYAFPIDELIRDGLKYKSKTPARNKAVMNYNYVIAQEGITSVYPMGNDTMCKYLQVLPNNKYNVDVIAWEDELPKEFEKMFTPNHEEAWRTGFMNLLDTWFDRLNYGPPKFEEDSMADFLGF